MAHIVADRVKETSTTTGLGNLTLAGAVSGFQAFSAVCANNDTFFYVIAHQTAAEYEVGLGTYVSVTPAIARTTIIESSNADAAVNFSAGTKDIFITSPAIGQGWGTLRVTPSINQNDYNPTGLKYCNILEVNPSASIKLTGLQGGFEGRRLLIRNVASDYLLWLEHENAASFAANRFKLPHNFPAFLMPGDSIELLYNDTADRWEICAWPNQGQAMGLPAFSDFHAGHIGQQGSTAVAGEYGLIWNGVGVNFIESTYLVNTTEKPAGVVQLTTGTSTTGWVTIGNISGVGSILPTLGAGLFVCRVARETAINGTDTYYVAVGLLDASGGSGNPNDGVAWELRWTGTAEEWSQTRWAGGAVTRSNTNSPTPDGNYIWLVVFVNPGWTRADFIYSTDSIAFTKADSPTTGLPGSTAPTGVCAQIKKSAGSTSRNLHVDLMGHRIDSNQRG